MENTLKDARILEKKLESLGSSEATQAKALLEAFLAKHEDNYIVEHNDYASVDAQSDEDFMMEAKSFVVNVADGIESVIADWNRS